MQKTPVQAVCRASGRRESGDPFGEHVNGLAAEGYSRGRCQSSVSQQCGMGNPVFGKTFRRSEQLSDGPAWTLRGEETNVHEDNIGALSQGRS